MTILEANQKLLRVTPPVTGRMIKEDATVVNLADAIGQSSNGGVVLNAAVDGLANNAVRQSAGTYNATVIMGFRVLLKGSGDLTFTPNTAGASAITIDAAELTAMGASAYVDFPIACSTITAGTAMELMVYIP